jgi:hypothetical protein
LYTISLPVQLSLGLAAYVNLPSYRHLLIQENSLLENLTAVFYLIAALMGVELFRRNKNSLELPLPTLLGVIGFLDELQWGETLLNLSMPIVAGTKSMPFMTSSMWHVRPIHNSLPLSGCRGLLPLPGSRYSAFHSFESVLKFDRSSSAASKFMLGVVCLFGHRCGVFGPNI